MLALGVDSPRLRYLDHAWASTVHAFQRRTVDNVIAVMEANHPHLATQKSFYVEISRAHHCAGLVTDDDGALCERLEAAIGEGVSSLEGMRLKPERTVRSDCREAIQMPRKDRLGEVSEPVRTGRSITVWSGRRCTESLATDWHSFGPIRSIRNSLNHDRRLLSADKTANDEPKMRCAT